MQIPVTWRGTRTRTQAQQVALVVRILDGLDRQDISDTITEVFGPERSALMRPIDDSRSPLTAYVDRVAQAYLTPPAVSGLGADLAALLGDYSASTTIEKYATIDTRPMPTTQAAASREAMRYRVGAGYAGVRIGWSERSRRLYLDTLTPDRLTLQYASDDPTEPTVIAYEGSYEIDGQTVQVTELFDLTDLEHPIYRVMDGREDVTDLIHGTELSGDAYWWRYSDGTPYHPIVITGHPRYIYRTGRLVTASLMTAARWTSWGIGTDHASHPQRNVRGLSLDNMDSSSEGTGVSAQAETVLRWRDDDPDRPGDHWMDAPAYDPETLGRAIRTYEVSAMSALGLPVSLESTGGDPTEHERRAVAELVATTFAEARRFDSEILRRCAATANRMPSDVVPGSDLSEDGYGVLYRDEVATALTAVAEPDTNDNEPDQQGDTET